MQNATIFVERKSRNIRRMNQPERQEEETCDPVLNYFKKKKEILILVPSFIMPCFRSGAGLLYFLYYVELIHCDFKKRFESILN